MAQEITRRSVLVSSTGGQIDYVASDGEILASVSVPAGRVPAADYLDIAPPLTELQLSGGLVCLAPRSGYGVQPYGDGSHDSGANPDFQPTSASRMQRQLEIQLAQMRQATHAATVAARQAQLAKVETMPIAPQVTPDPEGETPVVE